MNGVYYYCSLKNLWGCNGFDWGWIHALQVEEAPGFEKRRKVVHGNKNRVRALGFKNRLAAKRFGFKGRKLALAA
tara:strand:+ start:1112 stop:1336 length:225 start_codon:yes stop_codon:yes gene_type:complete